MTQGALLFGPRVTRTAAEYLDRFLDALTDGRWHKAGELQTRLHTSDRVLRKCADLSAGRVISSDQGYKLIRFATLEEIDEAENRLRSQARRMLHRVIEIRKQRNVYHRRQRVA